MGITLGGEDCVDPLRILAACQRDRLPTGWFGLPNSFTNVLGTDPGRGWVLLSRASLDSLDIDAPLDLVFTMAASESTLNQPFEVTIAGLRVVYAECVTPGLRGDGAGAVLVELADRRSLLRAVPVDAAYNVRSAPGDDDPLTPPVAYFSATLNAGAAWTWDEMVQDLWETVAGLGSYPGLPFSPDGVPESFDFYGGSSALEALGLVLDRLGCALRLDTAADEFDIVQLGAEDDRGEAAYAKYDAIRVFDAEPQEPVAGRVPESVRVNFAHQRASPDATGASPWYAVDVPLNVEGAEPDTVAVLYDDLPALFGGAGTLLNASALAARAAERAADYLRRVVPGRLRRVYAAPLGPSPAPPRVKAVRVGDRGRGLVTEVAEYPGQEGGDPFGPGWDSVLNRGGARSNELAPWGQTGRGGTGPGRAILSEVPGVGPAPGANPDWVFTPDGWRVLYRAGTRRVRVTSATLTDSCLFEAELVVRDVCADAAAEPPVTVWLRIDGPDLVGPPPWVPDVGDVYLGLPDGVRATDGLPVYVAGWLPTDLACPQIPDIGVTDLTARTCPDYLLGYYSGCLAKISPSGLPTETAPDYVLGLKAGCLVKVAVTAC